MREGYFAVPEIDAKYEGDLREADKVAEDAIAEAVKRHNEANRRAFNRACSASGVDPTSSRILLRTRGWSS
jgi:hypothetical protein